MDRREPPVDALLSGGAPTTVRSGPLPDASWAIECTGLVRDFGGIRALDHVDLAVPAGSVFGFLGPNGAGKTTTIRLLLGLLTPTAGEVRVLGRRLPHDGADVRASVGTVLENHGLYEGLAVRASLVFHARAHGLDRRAAGVRVEEVVERLGLADRLDDRPAELSRGMRQRMAVARALLGQPELLILDEPTNGLDPSAAAALRDHILALAAGGTTIFLTTHQLAEAERLCDVVTVVKAGRVIATGTPTDLRRGATVRRVRLEGPGLAAAVAAAGMADAVAQGPHAVSITVDGLDAVPALVAAIVRAGGQLHRVEPEGQTLEAAFLSLVGDPVPGDGSREGAA